MGQSHIRGQALFEVLIGLAVIAILVGGAVTLATVTLQSNAQNKFLQGASFLLQDLSDKLTVFAEGAWYCPAGCSAPLGLYNLAKGSQNHYYFSTTTPIGAITWKSGDEAGIMIDGVSYTRYFYIQNVCRDGAGDIKGVTASSCPVGGQKEDPSTQEVTVVVFWSQAGSQPSLTVRKNLTRYRNNVFTQTDWSGGPTGPSSDPALAGPLDEFLSASGISYGSQGAISLQTAILSGNLTSNIFDTCPAGLNCGAAINTIVWQGSLGSSGSAVRFQLASSDCVNGATNYPACNSCGSPASNCWDSGTGCIIGGAYSCFVANGSTAGFYSDPLISGHPIKVDQADHNNRRYIRYKAYLSINLSGDSSPTVNDVIINWSP